NAGLGVPHDVRERLPDPDAADGCLYANLAAPIRLITALLPRLRTRPEAAIINVTSGLAIAPNTASSVYCASKAGLRSYTMALRAQLAGEPIHVIEALPPVVDTQMTAGRPNKKMSPEECARQIIAALENGHDEANVGMVKILRAVYSISPALARSVMRRF
ncbi:MAG TPA: SDR family NAD(P)-dependent oxidoreductase, partial [Erythrobacter sp.]|nr:SDR family NAD(P)-dependent oxidoreductase [Erythrobacter sp.]